MTDLKADKAPESPQVGYDEQKEYITESSHSASGSEPYSEHGPGIDHQITQEERIQAKSDLLWSRIRHKMREPFSEFLGVFILILFGDGVVAQVVLSDGVKGSYQSISWGWGLGVMLVV
jgi:aquaglyceroporin related protein